jgi:hypothetical protein
MMCGCKTRGFAWWMGKDNEPLEMFDLARIIREVITNDSQWCKVGYESR